LRQHQARIWALNGSYHLSRASTLCIWRAYALNDSAARTRHSSRSRRFRASINAYHGQRDAHLAHNAPAHSYLEQLSGAPRRQWRQTLMTCGIELIINGSTLSVISIWRAPRALSLLGRASRNSIDATINK